MSFLPNNIKFIKYRAHSTMLFLVFFVSLFFYYFVALLVTMPINSILLTTVARTILVLIAVAYFTLGERKIRAAIQRRRGPNVVGFFGLLQPLADGLKLLCKEMVVPSKSQSYVFLIAPLAILSLSLVCWSVLPRNMENNVSILNENKVLIELQNTEHKDYRTAHISLGILFLLAISSLNVYGIIRAGWSSNSKYAFLGALRSAAQMISYEVSIGLTILPVCLLAGSLNITEIVRFQANTIWFRFPLFPCFFLFFISRLAETNRSPFDLPEAEAELVAGYNVEYSSIIFARFFLGEYSNMLIMSARITILFCGGWLPFGGVTISFFTGRWFSLKILFFCFLFVLVRATFPRYRYDQLRTIGWKSFLPITLGYFTFCSGLLYIIKFYLIKNFAISF